MANFRVSASTQYLYSTAVPPEEGEMGRQSWLHLQWSLFCWRGNIEACHCPALLIIKLCVFIFLEISSAHSFFTAYTVASITNESSWHCTTFHYIRPNFCCAFTCPSLGKRSNSEYWFKKILMVCFASCCFTVVMSWDDILRLLKT